MKMNSDILYCICKVASDELLVKLFSVSPVFRKHVVKILSDDIDKCEHIIKNIRLGPKLIETIFNILINSDEMNAFTIVYLINHQIIPENILINYLPQLKLKGYIDPNTIKHILEVQICSEKLINLLVDKSDFSARDKRTFVAVFAHDNFASEEFLEKYMDVIHVENIVKYQKLSPSFILRHYTKFMPYRKEIIKHQQLPQTFINQHLQ